MLYFIVGFKSSGKTTLGKRLANKMQMDFIDLDHFMEQEDGRTVPEIFVQDGEPEFRRKETEALVKITSTVDHAIVSTGGGAPCHSDNMQLMKKHGKILYLKVPDEVLVERLTKAALHRPIVKGKSEMELREYIRTQKLTREQFYLQADYIADGLAFDIPLIIERLEKL
jgi:shikimate kinase